MVNLRARHALPSPSSSLPPLTRSIGQAFPAAKASIQGRKRVKEEKAARGADVVDEPPSKKSKAGTTHVDEPVLPFLSRDEVTRGCVIASPKLPFKLSDAVQHLRSTDVRFHSLLDTIELTPYKELEDGKVKELDLFKTMATSIVGQQVSWLAARAIIYRFVRLFFPSLPEKPDYEKTPRDSLPFPHPIDVAKDDCTEDRLRTAGLSGAKVRYIKDIATRFSDGRLDVRKIVEMQEEECISELVKIKGVGRWTAEMLLIFALRRADILPVGDLGIQKGMVVFYLADASGPKISSRKKKAKDEASTDGIIKEEEQKTEPKREPIPVAESHAAGQAVTDGQTLQTGPSVEAPKDEHDTAQMPPLPDGIALSLLRARKEGKKAKGNVYLTPPEMESLAKDWAPFRSVACFLMYACIDGN